MDVLNFEYSNMKNGETFPIENTGRGRIALLHSNPSGNRVPG